MIINIDSDMLLVKDYFQFMIEDCRVRVRVRVMVRITFSS